MLTFHEANLHHVYPDGPQHENRSKPIPAENRQNQPVSSPHRKRPRKRGGSISAKSYDAKEKKTRPGRTRILPRHPPHNPTPSSPTGFPDIPPSSDSSRADCTLYRD